MNLKDPGLYVHIPFCKRKCLYCDFYSVTSLSLIPDWFEAVRKECLFYKDRFSPFGSLYLGGGTPTLLGDHEMVNLIHCLRTHFTFSGNLEFTVEANPDDITPGKLAFLQGLGVNRISLGIQSFDDQELRFLKRRHTAYQAEKALEWIRESGFPSLSLDLMYGLPGQTEAQWLGNLKHALRFTPEHMSCYQLTVEERTPLGRLCAEGRIKLLSEEEERTFFILTSSFLEANGYLHYEVSNYALGKDNTCRHNQKYWQHAPYLGLGPSAHSHERGHRWWNVRSVEAYCQSLARGIRPVEGKEILSQDQYILESLMLGFRTKEGLDLDLLPHESRLDMVLRDLQKAGLVQVQGRKAIPTRDGFLVADGLPLLFTP